MNLQGIHFGQFDVRVKIEQPTETIDPVTGERKITAWTEFARLWAKRMSESSERFEADQAVALTGSGYIVRHYDGITELMRVNDDDEYHYIKGIEKVDRKRFLVLKTEKRDNG